MSKALLSYAVGDAHQQMHELTLPSKRLYAETWGYTLIDADFETVSRPASWEKVGLLREALQTFDEVLFLGCDVLIAKDAPDMAGYIPPEAWHALVVHDVDGMPGSLRVGYVPNCDVWFLRKPMIPVLDQIESMSESLRDHGWWEQAACMQLMGFNITPPCFRQATSLLWGYTYELDPRWNYHPWAKCIGEPFFRHATGYNMAERLILMKNWVAGHDE